MSLNLGTYLNEKRGERSLEDIRTALAARGVDVSYSTVWRWFASRNARKPQLDHWVALVEVLGLSESEVRAAHGLLAAA